MLEIDAFFLNEDRHTNNIAVIYNEKTQVYSISPLFDQGLCLFADTNMDYPLSLSYEECLKKLNQNHSAPTLIFSLRRQKNYMERIIRMRRSLS